MQRLLLLLIFPCFMVQADSLEEIIVSASKANLDNQQAAVSQFTLSDQWLDDLYVNSYEQLAAFVPGLVVQEQSVNSAGFAVRGMTSDNPEASRTSRVSVWLHGLDISRTQGAYVAMYDLERVDVFKGPVGSLFGTGGQIGGINIINHLASYENSADIGITIGSFNELKLNAVGNAAMGEHAGARLALYSHQRDGYINNRDGNDLNSVDTQAARFSFSFEIMDVRSDLQINYEQNSPNTVAFQSMNYPVKDPFTKADLNNSRELGIQREITDVFARLLWPVNNDHTLSLSALYRDVTTDDSFDPDGTRLDLIEAVENADFNTLQVDLAWLFASEKLQGKMGISYFYEDVSVLFAAGINEQLAVRLPAIQAVPLLATLLEFSGISIDHDLFTAAGEPNPYTGLPLSPYRYEQQTEAAENESVSVYFDNTFYLTDTTQLTTGLRYSRERLRTSVTTPAYHAEGPTIAMTNLFLQADPAGEFQVANIDVSGFSGRLSLTQLIGQGLDHIYISYAHGRRPDILNYTEQSVLEHLRDETVDSYEIGGTWYLPDQYSTVSASLYYYDFRHFATQRSGVTALTMLSDDNASASVQGMELAWMQFFRHDYLLFANMSYNDAVFDESDIISGENRFRYAPLWSGSLSLSKDITLTALWTLRLTGQTVFQSEVFFEDDNSSNDGRNRQGSYQLLHFYADIQYRQQLTVNLFVRNAADKQYLIDAGNLGQLFGMPTMVPAIGRHWGAGIRYRF